MSTSKLKIVPRSSHLINNPPLLSNLAAGEIVVNRNLDSPAIYVRCGNSETSNANDRVIRFGPVVISNTTPAPSSATGETKGSLWFRPSTEHLNVFTGTEWVKTRSKMAFVGPSAPTTADDGDLWFDTDISALKVYLSSFSVWVEVSSGAIVAAYYGPTSPEHATSSITLLGFPQAAANGLYRGVRDFENLKAVTGTSQDRPPVGYSGTGGAVLWQNLSVYHKQNTGWFIWKQNGYWYIADVSRLPTAGAWYRSSSTVTGGVHTTASWVSVTTNEATPPVAGTAITSVTVQRTEGIIPTAGEVWFDSTIGIAMVWSGSSWLRSAGCSVEEFNQLKARVEALEAG